MDESSAFGGLGARLGLLLHSVGGDVLADLAARLTPLALTPVRAMAIEYVGRHDGHDQTRLGRALGVSRARAMKVVDDLAALGAVERRVGKDRRSKGLHLTPDGCALRARAGRIVREHEQVVFSRLSAREETQLRNLLGKLRRAARAEPTAR